MSELAKRFRKKPVVIETIQWTGDNLRDVIAFTGLHPSANKWTWEEYEEVVRTQGLKIHTLEGWHKALVGDWIIKGVKGEFYPCNPDIFEQTYESEAAASLSGVRVPVDELRIVTEFFGERNWPDTKAGNAAYALHSRLLAASKGERDE